MTDRAITVVLAAACAFMAWWLGSSFAGARMAALWIVSAGVILLIMASFPRND